jgi:hypothetical protein
LSHSFWESEIKSRLRWVEVWIGPHKAIFKVSNRVEFSSEAQPGKGQLPISLSLFTGLISL